MLPFWSFLAIAVPFVLTPGASTTVVFRNSLTGGTRAGVATAAGVNGGSLMYALLSAFGLAVLIDRAPSAWTLIRWGGTAYLMWLGWQSLRAAVVPPPRRVVADGAHRPRPAIADVCEGFATNALNPALATFYLVVVPQFIPRGAPVARSVLLLAAVHISLALTCHLVWAVAGGAMARLLAAGPARRAIDALTGVALIWLARTLVRG